MLSWFTAVAISVGFILEQPRRLSANPALRDPGAALGSPGGAGAAGWPCPGPAPLRLVLITYTGDLILYYKRICITANSF